MGALVGISQIADGAVDGPFLRFEGEGLGLGIALLQLHPAEIHRPGVDARRCAGFEAAHRQAQRAQALGQGDRRRKSVRPLGLDGLAHDGAAVQIGAGGDDHRPAAPDGAGARGDRADMPVLHADVDHLRLLEAQMLLPLQRQLHHFLIAPPIRLRAQGVHRRALAAVEHPVLDAGLVRRLRHLAAERVQLPHQVALAGAADGRVAGHVAHAVEIDGEADRVHAEPRGGQRGLDARVSCADHGDITLSRLIQNHACSSFDLFRAVPVQKVPPFFVFYCITVLRIWQTESFPRSRLTPLSFGNKIQQDFEHSS